MYVLSTVQKGKSGVYTNLKDDEKKTIQIYTVGLEMDMLDDSILKAYLEES